jgi:hypothetical protein
MTGPRKIENKENQGKKKDVYKGVCCQKQWEAWDSKELM